MDSNPHTGNYLSLFDTFIIACNPQVLTAEKIRDLTRLQSFLVPNLLRGLSMVGIAPSRHQHLHCGGKTLAYILPLISQLLRCGDYVKLPKGSEPYAVIMCVGWRQVDEVYCECKKYCRTILTCKTLYGGGSEDNKEVRYGLISVLFRILLLNHSLLNFVILSL